MQTNERSEVSSFDLATELAVDGMTCSGCARNVATAIQNLPGVERASVALEQNRVTVHWRTDPDASAAIRAVEEAGYKARLIDVSSGHSVHAEPAQSAWSAAVFLAVIPTALLMVGEWVLRLSDQPAYRWASLALATMVQFGPGLRFYSGAWRQLRVSSSNMDTLVALGSTTAFAYSLWALLSGAAGHLYFMEAAAIITLVSVGHWLEARVSARASNSLRALMTLAPPVARLRQSDGAEEQVDVARLRPGDEIVLKPGDRVPADGVATEGATSVDESMLTGESLPSEKSVGEKVYAGTVNLSGVLTVRVTSTGTQTALAHIINAVERAQSSRANIQRLGDRVSSVFVPIVVGIAIASGLWWGLMPEQAHEVSSWLGRYLWETHPPATALAAAMITAAAVLIIACPCAMGLATPAAIMAGSNVAAQRGILIRDGVALEKAGQITAVMFDKTGTLTVGKPAVVHFEKATSSLTTEQLAGLAAALAQSSNHPLSQAVSRLSEGVPTSRSPRLNEWQEIRGSGVQARLDDSTLVRLGSLRWLAESGVSAASTQTFVENWSGQGATVLGLAAGGELALLIAVKDTVKPGANGVVQQLLKQKLSVYLVTGDNPRTAAAIARHAGISNDNVFSEVRPEQKAAFVKQLQERGERVAFVGDGINDAPALEQADLGIAVSKASDIAREAADIILLRSEIDAVPESLGLARATLRTIKQNLFWAFFYNALGIPLAALGFMSPVVCAAAMGLSDLVVIGNALRLRAWKLKERA